MKFCQRFWPVKILRIPDLHWRASS